MRYTAAIVFVVLALIVGFGVRSAAAAEQTVVLTWDTAPVPDDLGGWRVYAAPAETGPWEKIGADITYKHGDPAGPYQLAHVLTPPDGEETTYWFAATAYDTSGNESARCAPVSKRIDYKPPQPPTGFVVEIRVSPQ
jgi:hypothetical protein